MPLAASHANKGVRRSQGGGLCVISWPPTLLLALSPESVRVYLPPLPTGCVFLVCGACPSTGSRPIAQARSAWRWWKSYPARPTPAGLLPQHTAWERKRLFSPLRNRKRPTKGLLREGRRPRFGRFNCIRFRSLASADRLLDAVETYYSIIHV